MADGNCLRRAGVAFILAAAMLAPAGCSNFYAPANTFTANAPAPVPGRPTMIEFFKKGCWACNLMEPVIANIQKQYAQGLTVQRVNVMYDSTTSKQYGVVFVPMQVYLDGAGNEIYHHIGLTTEGNLISKWHQLGYNLQPASQTAQASGANSGPAAVSTRLVFHKPAAVSAADLTFAPPGRQGQPGQNEVCTPEGCFVDN